jgi:hypothetical protein
MAGCSQTAPAAPQTAKKQPVRAELQPAGLAQADQGRAELAQPQAAEGAIVVPVDSPLRRAPQPLLGKPTQLFELEFQESLRTTHCHVRIVRFESARPGMLIISTNADENHPNYPAACFFAELPADFSQVADLTTQVLRGRMFVQQDPESPVWHTAPGAFVELRITAIDDRSASGEFLRGQLTSSDIRRSLPVLGRFEGTRE